MQEALSRMDILSSYSSMQLLDSMVMLLPSLPRIWAMVDCLDSLTKRRSSFVTPSSPTVREMKSSQIWLHICSRLGMILH